MQEDVLEVLIQKTQHPFPKPAVDSLGFGEYFSDHMLSMDYDGHEWGPIHILPYGPIHMPPSAMVFHYGQSVFEGMKAYRRGDQIYLFRPLMNFNRMNISNERMCMPKIPSTQLLEALKTMLKIDKTWIPEKEGTSLYIRPFVFATDPYLGVRPSQTYRLMIITSPVGAYYQEGIKPIKILVEEHYVRSVRGGVGFAKTIGNYAASMKAQAQAQKNGFSQVLWLDAIEHKYVEEVGTMNIFFVMKDEIITPSLDDESILPGVTRDSVIRLLRHWGHRVVERKLSIDELIEAKEKHLLSEVFGTGTAAVISPIAQLFYRDTSYTISDGNTGLLTQKLYDSLTKMQVGESPDVFNWVHPI